MGHHNFRRSWAKKLGIPKVVYDRPILVVKPEGISFGDFQREHAGLDGNFRGGSTYGWNWSADDLGFERYPPLKRIWRGTPPLMKASIGTGAAIGVASAEQARSK
jgi:hypothetical protein